MKITPLQYTIILLKEDFNQNPSQIATRLNLSLSYVYNIVNRYKQGQTLTIDYKYQCNNKTTQTRLNK